MIVNHYNIPKFEEIVSLEKKSNKEGSGIIDKDLEGLWKLQYVWKKGSKNIDNISSSLLQILSANLRLEFLGIVENVPNFKITNSIRFGLLIILFQGKASLKGNRPLLNFYFEKLTISFANLNLIKKSLSKPDLKKIPFFSLIAIENDKKWLCARGKGGGLALWLKNK
tara:strand:- start:880 stop:1383 length:504 start_codon:yes stop_codon:yes gene_type:complete